MGIRLIAVGGLFVATAAFAQTGYVTPPSADNDPRANETICRSTKDTGTRLSNTRVCMSRAEWAEHRRETRRNVDRAQVISMGPG